MEKIKLTKQQVRYIKQGWNRMVKKEERFYGELLLIEKWLAKKTGIEDIEFICDEMCTGHWVGVGNESRTMELLDREELET